MSDILTDVDLKTAKASEPAKRWRNWYRARYATTLRARTTGERISVRAGQKYRGQGVWPSKEVAEQKAAESRGLSVSGREYHEGFYLGAFPEGERPA